MKKIMLLTTCCIVAVSFSYCKQNCEDPEKPIIEEPSLCRGLENEKDVSLQGTKWKLAGVVDAETGELRELVPKFYFGYSEHECIRFDFDTDTTAIGRVVVNQMYLRFNYKQSDGSISPILIGGTKDDEFFEDEKIYYYALWTVYSYSVSEDSLKLFFSSAKPYYNDGKCRYLLYKLLER